MISQEGCCRARRSITIRPESLLRDDSNCQNNNTVQYCSNLRDNGQADRQRSSHQPRRAEENPRNGTHSSARLFDLRSRNAPCLASAHTDTRKGMEAISLREESILFTPEQKREKIRIPSVLAGRRLEMHLVHVASKLDTSAAASFCVPTCRTCASPTKWPQEVH